MCLGLKSKIFVLILVCFQVPVGVAAQDSEAIRVLSGLPYFESRFYAQSFQNWSEQSVELEVMPPGVLLSLLEQGLITGDVVMGLPIEMLVQLKQTGLLKPYRTRFEDSLPEDLRDKDGYWYPQYLDAVVLIYNTEVMERLGMKPPSSWNDLADSRWKGKLVMPSPITSNTGFSILSLWDQLFVPDSLYKIYENVSEFTRQDATSAVMVGTGNRLIGITSLHFALQTLGRGYPIKIAYPQEGSGLIAGGLGILSMAQNSLVEAFIDYMLSPEGQNLIAASARFRHPANIHAYTPPWAITHDRIPMAEYNWELAGMRRKILLQTWNNQIVGVNH